MEVVDVGLVGDHDLVGAGLDQLLAQRDRETRAVRALENGRRRGCPAGANGRGERDGRDGEGETNA